MKGFIVDLNHTNIDDKTFVEIFGRLENKQSFVALIPIKPYFFLEEKDAKKQKKYLSNFEIEKVDLKNFQKEKVVKISHESQTEINKIVKYLHSEKINTYEADIKPHSRFVIDNNLLGSIEIEGDYETSERVDRVYKNPKVKSTESKPELKVVSLDIETDRHGNLFCIGLYSKNYKKCFLITKEKNLKNTIACHDESDCLEKFRSEINKIDPDILTGWNFIDFDLAFLQECFKKNKIPFDISRNFSQTRVRLEGNFFKTSSAVIRGRLALDALNLIKDPFIKEAPTIKKAKFNSYTLEDVSQSLIGKGKLLKGKGRHDEINELYEKDQQKLVDYNLLDCELVYEILEKTQIIDLTIERSQLTGLTIDKVGGSIAAFDSLYIREARKRKLVSPSTHFGRKEERIKGGYVQTPLPGIYHNVLVLDFKSLYPSMMRTFNIDPSSFLENPSQSDKKNAIKSPNGAYFLNTDGILPEILEKLHNAREKAKKEGREFSNYAIKIILNSFFGVLASENCRYFNFDMANSITNFGQFLIQLTAKEIESKFKLKTIYSDTDSVFVSTKFSKEEAEKMGKKIQDHINNFYEKYITENYKRHSFLELEFEKLYLSLMFPKTRSQTSAAKKRYAGLIEKSGKEIIEITGLEAIRGDWTEVAQDFQKELLMNVFHKKDPTKYIKQIIKDIKSGKLDKKLVYRKSIRKDLKDYVKTTPPHVKAARKLDSLDSNIIEYYITEDGPEPIQKIKHKIDYEHYIKKQIEPIANQVLQFFEEDFKDILTSSKQSKLF